MEVVKQRPPGEFWSVSLAKDAIEPALDVANADVLQEVRDMVIATDDDQEFAAGLVREVKAHWGRIEEQRKKIVKPLNEAKNQTQALFKPVLETLEELEGLLKGKIADYLTRKQEQNAQALILAADAETAEQAIQALATVTPVTPPTGVSVRKVWRFVVEDESLVPREFCSPDPKKIGAVDPTTTQVPGVRFYEDAVVSARKG